MGTEMSKGRGKSCRDRCWVGEGVLGVVVGVGEGIVGVRVVGVCIRVREGAVGYTVY